MSWRPYPGAVSDLNDWQARWPRDIDAREGEALYVTPRFHSLVSDSPGHQASADGEDLGADLSRLGKTAAALPEERAAKAD